VMRDELVSEPETPCSVPARKRRRIAEEGRTSEWRRESEPVFGWLLPAGVLKERVPR